MIYQPRIGQRVQLRYARQRAQFFPYHGRTGEVITVAGRGGPVNALIKLDNGTRVVVPRGNLCEVK